MGRSVQADQWAQCGGILQAGEHLKEWLRGMKLEEDPETGPNNVGAGD